MKRSVQEIIELLVFALIALVIGTGLVWVVGWLFGIIGFVLMEIAEFVWLLLRYIIPAAVIVAAVYALVKLAQNQNRRSREASPAGAAGSGPAVYSATPRSGDSANRSTLGESVATAPQPTVTASPAPGTSGETAPGDTPPRVEAVPAPDKDEGGDESGDETASAGASSDSKAEPSGSAKKAPAERTEPPSERDAQTVGTEGAEPGEGFQEMVEDEQDLPEDVQNKKGGKKDGGKKGK